MTQNYGGTEHAIGTIPAREPDIAQKCDAEAVAPAPPTSRMFCLLNTRNSCVCKYIIFPCVLSLTCRVLPEIASDVHVAVSAIVASSCLMSAMSPVSPGCGRELSRRLESTAARGFLQASVIGGQVLQRCPFGAIRAWYRCVISEDAPVRGRGVRRYPFHPEQTSVYHPRETRCRETAAADCILPQGKSPHPELFP